MGENKDATKRQFRCEHCHGLIIIPVDLPPTKGPCPHCAETIESPAPPKEASGAPAPASIAPLPPPQQAPAPSAVAPPHPAPPASASRKPAAPAQELPTVLPVSKGAPARSGKMPVEGEAAASKAAAPEVIADSVEPPARRRRSRIIPVAIAILLVAVALLAAVFVARDYLGNAQALAYMTDEEREMEVRRARYLRVGWKDDAREALGRFIAASTIEEKAALSLGGESLIEEMTRFYGSDPISDSDTPAENFSAYELRLEDRERSLFLMIYDQPPQFDIGEFFRPLATLEVQHQVEPPDMLLASFARAGNFVMDPVRVQAFFKKVDDEMKIDWHVFTQTKHRLLRNFLYAPEAGRSAVFRVLVGEDVPEAGREESGTRTYRVSDPVYRTDSVRVRVPVDSEIGRHLSKVNWRGSDEGKQEMRTATLELGWQGEDEPEVVINRMLSWEFLGLGGEALVDEPDGS
jgi:hypothetical protein